MFSILRKFILILILLFILGFQILALVGVFPNRGADMTNQTRGYPVTVAGEVLRVFYGENNGPDVLLIHGCPGMVEDWDALISKLYWGFHVVAYDRPGYGASEGKDIPYTMGHNADIALELMDQLDMKDAVVVGHSYGAGVALNMAVRKPERVKAFVLAGSFPYNVGGDIPEECQRIGWPFIGSGIAYLYGPYKGKEFIRTTLAELFKPETPPPGFIKKRMSSWSKPRILISLSRELLHFDDDTDKISPRYPNIRKPVYVVSGSQDPGIKQAVKLSRAIPGAKITEIRDAGHYINVTQTQVMADLIEEASNYQKP
jgi:pimeloyl-ACP methyl ester carboxylesterase